MNFGLSNLKNAVPAKIGWLLGVGGSITTAMAAINVLYPTIITEHVMAETGKLFALIGIIAPFFGIKKDNELIP